MYYVPEFHLFKLQRYFKWVPPTTAKQWYLLVSFLLQQTNTKGRYSYRMEMLMGVTG